MAARSSSSSFPPSSPVPPPPNRQLGPWSPRVGRGAVVHAVRSEASGLADTAQGGVGDKSDKSWQGEEGSGGRRGPGRAAAVQAPLLSSPVGSKPLEGISVEEAMVTRTQLLEEELSSLKEELALCQADKEFVWSLWKRLQVTNPDLTQAVSLVVEREKQKSEAKDRKVLEILQVKDAKIQELEQRESGLKQEINDLIKRKIAVDEENIFLRNEFRDLQKKFKDRSKEVKDTKECVQNKEEHNRLVIKSLEEENEKLNTRCADLLNDLEKLRKQEAHWKKEKHSIDAKIKLYNELHICFETTKSNEAMLRQSVVSLQDQLFQQQQENSKLKEKLQEPQKTLRPLLQESDSDHLEQVSQQPSLSSLETLMVSQKSEIEYLQEKLKIANEKLSENMFINQSSSEKSILTNTKGKHKEPPVKRSRSLSPRSSFTDSEELRKLRKAERKIENLEKALQLKSQENDELRDAHEKRKERLQMLQTNYRAVKEQLKQWEEDSGIEIRKIKRAGPQQLTQEDSDAVWNELAHFKRENQELMIQKMNLQEELDTLKVHMCVDKATIQELNAWVAEKKEEQLFQYGDDDGVKKSTPKKNGKEISEQTLQKIIELENRIKSFEKRSRKLKEGNKKIMKENYFLKSLLKQQQEDSEARGKELEQLQKRNKEVEKHNADLQVKISELEREVTLLKRQVAEANGLRSENEELISSIDKLQHSADKAKTEMATTEVRASDCKTTTTKVKFKATKKKCSVGRYHTVLNHSIKVKSNMFENLSKDGWEDVSESSSDSETQTSQNLGTIIVETSQKISPIEDGRDQKESDQTEDSQMQGKEIVQIYSNPSGKTPKEYFHYKNPKKSTFPKKYGNIQKNPYTAVPNRVNRERWKTINAQKSNSSIILLRERIISLQQQISVLQNAKKTAELSVKEYKEVNEKLIHQQQVSDQRFQTSRQTIKKLHLDLAGLRKEKEALLKKLESSSEITSLTDEISRVTAPQIQRTSLGPSRSMDLEMKQLQCKLKNATNELTKQSSNVKSLKFELLTKEEHIKEMHEKMSRMERDITMKRHLIEDLKFRQKVNLESNESINEMLESLEKKVKTLTEECSNKKVSVDSLKQRLGVAIKEKSQYEQMYQKTKEELEKKDLKLNLLVSKVNETESALAEIETAASKHLQGLALQSEQALEGAQKKLLLANEKVEEFTMFVKALVKELQNDVHQMRRHIRELKKMQKNQKANKTSTHKAQTLAASILNISRSDLEEILDTEDEVEMERTKTEAEHDQEWLLYIQKLLEGQLPFASYLLEAVLEKVNEKKKLDERYFTIMKDIR
ncbi:PREDICTED: centlein isoform X5 [Condylura cristata]|uniref:centlein isoform X5 n=1 Tax=Condylura cristata TaxID=143302 RepID=UPI000642EC90|nr:PREDICTED: centlein isoform X5 [Condylura cristata]